VDLGRRHIRPARSRVGGCSRPGG